MDNFQNNMNSRVINTIYAVQGFAAPSSKAIINKVLIDNDCVVATDGYRLMMVDLNDGQNYGKFILEKMKKPKKKNVTGVIESDNIVLSDGQILKTELPSQYPSYHHIIPLFSKLNYMDISTNDLKDFLNFINNDIRLLFQPNWENFENKFLNIKINGNLNVVNDRVKLDCRLDIQDAGYGSENSNQEFWFMLNSSFLKDAMNTLPDNSVVRIGFTGPLSPVVLLYRNITHIIMPLNRC